MNILIVVPRDVVNDDVNYNYMFPLGLGYISSVLKQGGHHVDILHLNHYKGAVSSLYQDIVTNNKYDFVCTGGISTSYPQIKMVVEAFHKERNGAGLILGGGVISSEPELMFNALNPDYIVIGEGENTLIDLVGCIENSGNIEDVNGIGYRNKEGNIVFTAPRQPISDLDSLPWPDFDGFDFESYLDHMQPTDFFFYDLYDFPRVYPIISSRSCPYKCTFCFHPLGNKYRQRSIDSLMEELEVQVKKYRINIISIYDELFSYKQDRVHEFCIRITNLLETIPWECQWTCQMRTDRLDEKTIKIMKEAGCCLVSYGFESYSQKVLKSMRKKITPEQIDRAVRLNLRNNLSLQANFLFGDVAETEQTSNESLDYLKQHKYSGIVPIFVNPYPGTALYRHCIERGIIKNKLDFIENHISDIMNMSSTMTEYEFEYLKVKVFEAKLRYRVATVVQSMKKVVNGTYNISVQCPYCRKIVEYKNFYLPYRLNLNHMIYCRKCRYRFFIESIPHKVFSKSLLLCSSIINPRLRIFFFNIGGKIIMHSKPFIKRVILAFVR